MKMNTESIKSESTKLLDFIDGLSELTWRKFQDRYPESWNGTTFQRIDQSAFPPFFSFRFKSEPAGLINELKEAVTSYTGKVEWIMVGHERDPLPGINWMICPKRYWDLRDEAERSGLPSGKYMADHEPKFGPIAHDDMLELSRHIRGQFAQWKTRL